MERDRRAGVLPRAGANQVTSENISAEDLLCEELGRIGLEALVWAIAAKAPKTVRIMLRSPRMIRSTAETVAQLEGVTELVERFLQDQERQEASPQTRA